MRLSAGGVLNGVHDTFGAVDVLMRLSAGGVLNTTCPRQSSQISAVLMRLSAGGVLNFSLWCKVRKADSRLNAPERGGCAELK